MESGQHREPWNKGKLVGQKPPRKPKDIWAIRIYLQNAPLTVARSWRGRWSWSGKLNGQCSLN
jgi:hypothetical protein